MIAEHLRARPDHDHHVRPGLDAAFHGSQMIRTAAMVQLLLGNIGMAGGGMNALRGHSNIQGQTDLGLLSNLLPGYMTLPGEKETDYQAYIDKRAQKPLRPGQLTYWQNYPKFHVSLMKAWWGDAATTENNWCYDWLPKLDKAYDVLQVFEQMHQGKVNGYVCQGFNPLAAFPNKAKIGAALAKLKYPGGHRSAGDRDLGVLEELRRVQRRGLRRKIQTEVFRLPSTCFAEEDGSLVNSGRWLQWHWKGAEPPGDAKGDQEIIAGIFLRLRELYKKEGGAFPDPILNLTWPYKIPHAPSAEELAREFNGKALADITDPKDTTKVIRKAGEQLDGFAQLRDDGTTACGCWIFSGAWTEKGNADGAARQLATRSGLGNTLNWAFAWPANRRILYNRASSDPAGKPWDPKRKLIGWDGTKWGRHGHPGLQGRRRHRATAMNPFIMNPEGVARLFAVDKMAEGPFPEHYEPFETPIDTNPMHPKVVSNPGARVFKGDWESFGKSKDYPYACTTYRLTEHFHYWTKHVEAGRHHPAGAVRRDRRGTGAGEGHQGGRHGEGELQPRLHQGQGGGDQAHQAAAGGRARRSTTSACRSTGASRAWPRTATSPTP